MWSRQGLGLGLKDSVSALKDSVLALKGLGQRASERGSERDWSERGEKRTRVSEQRETE